MSNIRYKTRTNSSPQGKARVYMCCHPKDLPVYFDEMAKEILSRYNCVFCYEEEPDQEYDEDTLFTDLGRMQLFLVPVTKNFLYEKSRALEVELPFAKEQRIPILPLIQDSSLVGDFNEICGSLQYLDKKEKDETSRSYEEKLSKFLEGVLIQDEEAEDVRAAFDAYIFLSYRKKDRKYAQELMKIIHKIDFCRDVAIWYDEFLSPGENFNGAIEQALKKSQLFLMTVTPNLVEEENYVAGVEYPLAKELLKPVLPIEMVKTDREKLAEKFEGNLPLIDPANEADIISFLHNKLKDSRLWSRAHFPEHDYLIGLAYLNGIDVEIDYEKAISLIRSSAERGYEKAIIKMIDIYGRGIGVERNVKEETYWNEKLVEVKQEQFEKDSDQLEYLMESIYQLALHYFYNGEYDKAKEQCHMLKKLIKSAVRHYYYVSYILYWLGVTKNTLARIYLKEGNTKEAKKMLKQSMFLNSILCFTGSHGAQKDRSVIWLILGDAYRQEQNWEKARGYYKKAQEYLLEVCEEEQTIQSRHNVIASYKELAECAEEGGQIEEAIFYYEKMMEEGNQLRLETGNIEEARCYWWNGEDYAEALKKWGKEEEVVKVYESCARANEEIGAEAWSFEIGQNLSFYYTHLGKMLENLERPEEAYSYHLKSLEVNQLLLEEEESMEIKVRFVSGYMDLGDIKRKKGQTEDALEYYNKAFKICAELMEEDPEDSLNQESLALIYYRYGLVKEEQREEYYGLAAAVYESMARQFPDEEVWKERSEYMREKMKSLDTNE